MLGIHNFLLYYSARAPSLLLGAPVSLRNYHQCLMFRRTLAHITVHATRLRKGCVPLWLYTIGFSCRGLLLVPVCRISDIADTKLDLRQPRLSLGYRDGCLRAVSCSELNENVPIFLCLCVCMYVCILGTKIQSSFFLVNIQFPQQIVCE
jgi:hypothetical protein